MDEMPRSRSRWDDTNELPVPVRVHHPDSLWRPCKHASVALDVEEILVGATDGGEPQLPRLADAPVDTSVAVSARGPCVFKRVSEC